MLPSIITKTVTVADNKATGAAARAFRESRGIRAADVAARVGISISYLSLVERGMKADWTEQFLARYIAAVQECVGKRESA